MTDKKLLELFKILLRYIPYSIWFKDREHKFILVSWNKANNSGFTPEQMVGKTDFDLFAIDVAEQIYKDDELVMSTGEKIEQIEQLVRKEGEINCVLSIKVPIYNEDGKIVGIMGISNDITDKIKVWEEVRHGIMNPIAIAGGKARRLLKKGYNEKDVKTIIYELEKIEELLKKK